jgi:predicted RNase H-like HicB family nuclease
MNEIIFLVEEADEGGYQARALEHSIFTDAETMESLKDNIREAVHCHFELSKKEVIEDLFNS